MDDLTLLGSVLVAILGALLFYRCGFLKKYEESGLMEKEDTAATVIDKRDCRSRDGGDDVIIVGAGVAGAALAHTLGKVPPFSFLFFFKLCFVCLHYMHFQELD